MIVLPLITVNIVSKLYSTLNVLHSITPYTVLTHTNLHITQYIIIIYIYYTCSVANRGYQTIVKTIGAFHVAIEYNYYR